MSVKGDRKGRRLNPSHTGISPLSLKRRSSELWTRDPFLPACTPLTTRLGRWKCIVTSKRGHHERQRRSEGQTSEPQSHRYLPSFPKTTFFRAMASRSIPSCLHTSNNSTGTMEMHRHIQTRTP